MPSFLVGFFLYCEENGKNAPWYCKAKNAFRILSETHTFPLLKIRSSLSCSNLLQCGQKKDYSSDNLILNHTEVLPKTGIECHLPLFPWIWAYFNADVHFNPSCISLIIGIHLFLTYSMHLHYFRQLKMDLDLSL